MVLVDFYRMDMDDLAAFLKKVQAGDDMHKFDAFAFPAEKRVQLDVDVAAWDESMGQVPLLDAHRDETKQTRDETGKVFRVEVRPAREWARGEFPGDDERSREYGLGKMPPRGINAMVSYGRSFIQANTQEPPLEPVLPERLFNQAQAAFNRLEENIAAYNAAVVRHKGAVAGRRELRKAIEKRVRGLRQYLYTHMDKDDPALLDYGFAR